MHAPAPRCLAPPPARSPPRRRQIRALAALGAVALCAAAPAFAQPAPTPQPAPAPAAQATPAQATGDQAAGDQATPAEETWAVHGQSTATWLLQPGFAASYQGRQSLSAAANGRETVDLTAYFGVRPWSGAEIWFNPEIDQGFGLSDAFGAVGYVSGEAYKVGAQDPYVVIPRLFIRQTIDLGGETQQLAPAQNQLAGTQTADRLIITAGKISIGDVFDTNTYAHDPRNDFLNWTNIDSGAFDYAANSWGYTYGAAAEWYQDWWAIRQGLFNLSVLPNAKNINPRILAQFQSITELEARYDAWGQPGKIRFLYWIDRGQLGLYDDAIAYGLAHHVTPATAFVRDYRTKDGVELNWEQQIADGLGVFLRAGASQGSVEEDAFTDSNETLSGGLSLAGARWHRPDDTVGAALAVSQISHAGKLYLAAGGLGGIIGDGRLPDAGPEQVFETYYSAAVFKFTHLTVDYQALNHPAYNRDRGPVSVFALRLHAQF